ncbi:MAG: site-specific integrase, partial [Alphaproteobacteria bacterium]|nr:site-specific integrase [Alphaproteobacteria bacterium]
RASWHTVHASFSDLKLFFTFLKNHRGNLFCLKDFETIKPMDLRSFLAYRMKKEASKRSNARLLYSLNGFV